MRLVMPIFKLEQEIMFVNTCVKFRNNRLRNEVYRAVTPFEWERTYEHTYVGTDPYIPCEGIITKSGMEWNRNMLSRPMAQRWDQ